MQDSNLKRWIFIKKVEKKIEKPALKNSDHFYMGLDIHTTET